MARLKSGLDYFAGFLVLMNSMVLLLQFEMEGRPVLGILGLYGLGVQGSRVKVDGTLNRFYEDLMIIRAYGRIPI